MEVSERIRREIRAVGPIPFDRFMELALYDPEGGFFSGEVLRSEKGGDFLTSPEVSPLFGATLAGFVAAERARIGPHRFSLVEVAGGSGSLLSALLAAHQVDDVWAVEVAPSARRRLARTVGDARVVTAISDLPSSLRGVVLANELLDNLPMAVAQLGDCGWRERWVGLAGEALEFVDAPARESVVEWLDRFAGPTEPGGWVEAQLEACEWVHSVLSLIEEGALLLIDYGDTAENLAPRRRDGTLRTYRAHHLGPHPLDEPGATDITADVNFTAIADAALRAGAKVEIVRQDDFLTRFGLRDRVSALRREELELARAGAEMERLVVRTRRTEAETLLHPRGLGDFRVLVATV